MKITRHWLNTYLDHPASTDDIVRTLGRLGFPIENVEPLPGDDDRLDVEVTSNRGDCLSVLGLAREFVTGSRNHRLAAPTIPDPSGAADRLVYPAIPGDHLHAPLAASSMTVDNRDHALCPYYSARVLRGLTVGPSPEWLRTRIEGVGLRSVNNVVDVTNFVLFELGQPLHAFDLGRLAGTTIVVRTAKPGETIVAIDGSRLTLLPSDLVIADARGPVAVAGVMGGRDSEVGDATVDVLLEAAVFSPMSVRSTARRLRLMTDSSHRFERGIHPALVTFAAERAVDLLLQVAGGRREPGVAEAGDLQRARAAARPRIEMRVARCQSLLGVAVTAAEMKSCLDPLGLDAVVVQADDPVAAAPRAVSPSATPGHVQGGATALVHAPAATGAARSGSDPDPAEDGASIVCCIPWHRLDLEREVDLIEEVARVRGLDHIPTRDKIDIEVAPIQIDLVNRRRVEEVLTACGFYEVVTFSFISVADAEAFLPGGFALLSVADERRKAEPVLRPSLLPSLLRCRKRNQDLGHHDVRLFESAMTYCLRGDQKVEQGTLGLVLDATDRQQSLRLLRAAVERVVRSVRGPAADVVVRPVSIPWFEAGGAGTILLDGVAVGTMGVLTSATQGHFDLQTPICAAEVALGDFIFDAPPVAQVREVPSQPSIERDLSIVVDEPIAWSKVREVVDQVEHAHLVGVDFVGVFRGKQVGPGRKSVTLRLTYRAPDRTLRHEEVTPHVEAVVARLAHETGATLRQ